jgi:predicted RNA-binding Zn ribbon-like protein
VSDSIPGGLELLRAFINTADSDTGVDSFTDRDGLTGWLRGRGLLGAAEEADGEDLHRALRLRAALRRLAAANHEGVADPAAAQEVDAVAGQSRLVVRFGEEGTAHLEAEGKGVDGALARLLAALYTATIDGTWSRLKVCRNDACGWAFYDRSKNRSGRFCGTGCGNAVNARAYRRRQAAASAADG